MNENNNKKQFEYLIVGSRKYLMERDRRDEFNAFGKEGWEICGIIDYGTSLEIIYKREIV